MGIWKAKCQFCGWDTADECACAEAVEARSVQVCVEEPKSLNLEEIKQVVKEKCDKLVVKIIDIDKNTPSRSALKVLIEEGSGKRYLFGITNVIPNLSTNPTFFFLMQVSAKCETCEEAQKALSKESISLFS